MLKKKLKREEGGMYVRKYVCALCGYVYDEAKGIPEQGIAPGTKWEDLPDDWSCPDCTGATKTNLSFRAIPAAPGSLSLQMKSSCPHWNYQRT